MEYQVITPEGVEYLKSVTAPDRVFYGDEIEYDYAHDEMPDFGTHAPDVLVEVLSTEEVSKVMRYAYEHCIPVTPRGAGTGLSGGAVPLSLSRVCWLWNWQTPLRKKVFSIRRNRARKPLPLEETS